MQELLQRHELEAFDAYFSSIHGGSIVLYAGHPGVRPKSKNLSTLAAEEQDARTNEIQTYFEFADRVQQLKQQTIEFLCNQKAAGKRVFGFGAPVKGNTFLNFCEIDSRQLDYLVEKNPLRKGLYSPGMHIPIVLEDELEAPPDVYFVLAWNFRKEILSKNRDLIDNGVEFYFPIEPDLP